MTDTGQRFRDAVLARDMDAVEALLAEDVVFRSPAVFKPYEGRTSTEMVAGVFESHRTGGVVTFPLKNRENPLTMLE